MTLILLHFPSTRAVIDVATEALVDACLDWAGEDREQRQQVLTVLNRATRVEHGAKASRAEAQLGRLVRMRAAALGGDFIKVALETPGRLLDLCSALEPQLESLDEPALAAIDDALPHEGDSKSQSILVRHGRVAFAVMPRPYGSRTTVADVLPI